MERKIKILEVLDCYYPKFDGPTQVVTNYCKCFMNLDNVEVEALVPKYKNFVDVQPFKVNRCKSMGGPEGYRTGLPALDNKMKKYLKAAKFSVIHCHSPFTMGRFAFSFGKKNKIPTVFTFHTKYKEDIERTVKSPLLRKIAMNYIMKTINMADYVLTVSDGAADCLREYGYKKDIKVVRNGTDLKFLDNHEKLVQKVNDTYNLNPNENVFLSVGRIVENKKLSLSLQALKVVKSRGFKFKFLIVGAGPYEKELKRLCSEYDLDDCVIFTGKVMDREFLSAHYLRSDLFLFPSTFDTASLAPIEAAALKLPTLMTKGCSTAEIITDERNGMLEDPVPEKWADKIISIVENKDKLETLRKHAYNEVFRTWKSVSDEIFNFYQSII